MTPLTLMTLNANLAKLMIDTQAVMTLRLLGMAGALPQTRGENARMVNEKGPAMAKAYQAATKAAFAGGTPDQIFSAAMVPVSKKVRPPQTSFSLRSTILAGAISAVTANN